MAICNESLPLMNHCPCLPFWLMKAQQEEREKNYLHLLATEDQNLIPNTTETDCPICFSTLQPGEGIVLRECLHTFCRSDAVNEFAALSYVVKVLKIFCLLSKSLRWPHTYLYYLQNVQRLVFLMHLYICIFLICVCVSLFRECLKGTIVNSHDAEVSCPDKCESKLLDREIKSVSVKTEEQETFWMDGDP